MFFLCQELVIVSFNTGLGIILVRGNFTSQSFLLSDRSTQLLRLATTFQILNNGCKNLWRKGLKSLSHALWPSCIRSKALKMRRVEKGRRGCLPHTDNSLGGNGLERTNVRSLSTHCANPANRPLIVPISSSTCFK